MGKYIKNHGIFLYNSVEEGGLWNFHLGACREDWDHRKIISRISFSLRPGFVKIYNVFSITQNRFSWKECSKKHNERMRVFYESVWQWTAIGLWHDGMCVHSVEECSCHATGETSGNRVTDTHTHSCQCYDSCQLLFLKNIAYSNQL